jgi:hypothetical protein
MYKLTLLTYLVGAGVGVAVGTVVGAVVGDLSETLSYADRSTFSIYGKAITQRVHSMILTELATYCVGGRVGTVVGDLSTTGHAYAERQHRRLARRSTRWC